MHTNRLPKSLIYSIGQMSRFHNFKELNRIFFWIIVLLGSLALADLTYHYFERDELAVHEITEGLFILFIIMLVIAAKSGANHTINAANLKLHAANTELQSFRSRNQNLLSGMRSAIHEQFNRWALSESEGKLAELLIRGYSFKQIAGMLEKSEKTVRNQSQSVYDKSGMTGRIDLAAFFLEDLFESEDDPEFHY